jgi:heme/copper-type cytochrome/quinol oxidase subunit 2
MLLVRVLLATVLSAVAASAGAAPRHTPRRINVEVNAYFGHFVPTVIRAQYGDTIHVTLKANDSAHGFMVEGRKFDITAYPGMPAEVTFVADWEGGKEWFCTFDCGPQHGTMTGMIVVTRD